MTNRRALGFVLRAAFAAMVVIVALARGAAASGTEIRIAVVERDDDGFYEKVDGADGLYREQRHRPFPGAELGAKDIAALGATSDVSYVLEHFPVPADADVAEAVRRAVASGAAALLLDLPADDMRNAAAALPPGRIALFNIRQDGDDLRRDLCASDLFHVLPSQGALTDALAQFVVRRNWRRVLMLVGPEEDDAALAKSFQNSARKFGARIVETKAVVEGNDPRNRDRTNVALLTAGVDYDAVFVADTVGDFGRFIQYRMGRPRPVLGSAGLRASAWHGTSERYGAPQVNRRFERLAHRPMTSLDWSAWVAVRAIGEAVARTSARTPEEILRILRGGELPIELSKGVTGSFRPWDRQLRQPIMLHTSDAVIEFAPLEGFLHEHSTLDTLGLGQREVPCGSR